MTLLHWTLPLPTGYRRDDVIAFHSRDGEAVAEQVTPTGLRKGILMQGVPVVLDVAFTDTEAVCRAEIDGDGVGDLETPLHGALLNILGLRIDPQPFAQLAANDPLLAPLVSVNPGLRIVQSASPFEALTWAIIGQQINLPFAIALRRTFILQAGRRHGSGLWCYPEARDVARLSVEDLTSRKFSRAKAETVLRLARLVDEGELSLELPPSGDVAAISPRLAADLYGLHVLAEGLEDSDDNTTRFVVLAKAGRPVANVYAARTDRVTLDRLRADAAAFARGEAVAGRLYVVLDDRPVPAALAARRRTLDGVPIILP